MSEQQSEDPKVTGITIETVHTITLPLYPPPPPEANAYGQPTTQVICLNADMARELLDMLARLLGE